MLQLIAVLTLITSIVLLGLGLIIKRINRIDYYVILTTSELDGKPQEKEYPYASSKIIIGRDPSLANNKYGLCLMDPFVSWIHLKILLRKDGIYVVDLQSTNGTYLANKTESSSFREIKHDMQPIPPKTPVEFSPETTIILVGNTEIKIEKKPSKTKTLREHQN